MKVLNKTCLGLLKITPFSGLLILLDEIIDKHSTDNYIKIMLISGQVMLSLLLTQYVITILG